MQVLGSIIKEFNFGDSLIIYRIHDSLLSRLSNDDDLEKSLSTFASEMATSAMILGKSRQIEACARLSSFYQPTRSCHSKIPCFS